MVSIIVSDTLVSTSVNNEVEVPKKCTWVNVLSCSSLLLPYLANNNLTSVWTKVFLCLLTNYTVYLYVVLLIRIYKVTQPFK